MIKNYGTFAVCINDVVSISTDEYSSGDLDGGFIFLEIFFRNNDSISHKERWWLDSKRNRKDGLKTKDEALSNIKTLYSQMLKDMEKISDV